MQKFKSLLMKVVKGGIAAGLANVAVVLQANHYQISSLADAQVVLHAVATAFIGGIILAIIKWATWKEAAPVIEPVIE